MIEYNYVLRRDLKSHVHEYTPIFDTNIKNIAKFKGRNSSGKTTLLNFIAISAYGLDNRVDMIHELRQKIGYLYNSEDSDFEFEMSVDNVHTNTKLKFFISKNENGRNKSIRVEESIGGLPFEKIDKERFLKKYRLIYDMPYRPMKRIQELARETVRAEKKCMDDVDSLKGTLRGTIQEISRAKDQNKIESNEKKLKDAREKLREAEEQREYKNILNYKMECLYNARDISEKHEKYAGALKNQVMHEKRKKENNSKDMRAYNEYEAKLKEIKQHLEKAKSSMLSSLDMLKKLNISSKNLSTWASIEIDVNEILKTKKIPYDIEKPSDAIEYEIRSKYHSDEQKSKSDTKIILMKIMEILKPHLNENMIILDKDMKHVFNELDKEVKSINKSTEIYNNAKDVENAIKDTRNNFRYAEKGLFELGPKPKYNSDDNSEFFDNLEANVKELKKELDLAINAAIPFGIDVSNFGEIIDELSEDPRMEEYNNNTAIQLSRSLFSISAEVRDINKEIDGENGLIKKIGIYEGQLEILRNAKDHGMKDYLPELMTLEKELNGISNDLSKKHNVLEQIANGKLKEGEEQFLNLVWSNIGKRLKIVQHVGKNYEVLNVNMKEGFIETKDGTRITFESMGTGESQKAYLMGILNNTDERVLIALFDEVEHMDLSVIKSIQDKLSELYAQGKLLVGLMAAPGNSTEVENYEYS
jgi:Dynein, heavy chain